MAKNKKVMSIAIVPELHDELIEYSKKKGMSVSSYVGVLIEKAVKLSIDDDPIIVGRPIDEDVLPVVLKIPNSLKGDKEGLQAWINAQTAGILSKLGS